MLKIEQEIRVDRNDDQLRLWDDEEEPTPQIKMDELDTVHIWKLAVSKFDSKRWREGWRPWNRRG